MEKLTLTCPCGASITIEESLSWSHSLYPKTEEWRQLHQNCSKQLTTAELTQTVPTTEEPSVVEEPTYLATRQSSPSVPVGTKSGPVEQSSECAHKWKTSTKGMYHWWTEPLDGTYRYIEICLDCRALMWSDKTVAQDVDPTSSTSVKQPLKESVENSVEESVKSLLKKWTVEEHVSWGPAAKPQYGITDGTYHILLPKDETHSMAEQHAKYLTERHY